MEPVELLSMLEVVVQVVCVSLPGYVIASLGHFNADKQKFVASLNVMVFTPCLIFAILASQLSAETFSNLPIIPAVFVVQTLVSWVVSVVVSKLFRFNRRAANFVTAMSVFGNSNSLPVPLVLSLSRTIRGLCWDRIPSDDDDQVAARGILYILIFQQLGQLLRWSWGHVLLASEEQYSESPQHHAEDGQYQCVGGEEQVNCQILGLVRSSRGDEDDGSIDSHTYIMSGRISAVASTALEANGSHITTLPSVGSSSCTTHRDVKANGILLRVKASIDTKIRSVRTRMIAEFARLDWTLPRPVWFTVAFAVTSTLKIGTFVWKCMSPPLWAMLMAILVASVRKLHEVFFKDGSLINSSVTTAVRSGGGVAVPLDLVVLGANLATMTTYDEDHDPEEDQVGTRLLIASLLSRMLFPSVIMAPVLAVTAKRLPTSILDDPIFSVVCFMLMGAPSAVQVAQICQSNNFFKKTTARLLFQSYVFWILPSTLVLVMTALEVVA